MIEEVKFSMQNILAGINFWIKEEQYSVWPKIYYLCKNLFALTNILVTLIEGKLIINYVNEYSYWTIFQNF